MSSETMRRVSRVLSHNKKEAKDILMKKEIDVRGWRWFRSVFLFVVLEDAFPWQRHPLWLPLSQGRVRRALRAGSWISGSAIGL